MLAVPARRTASEISGRKRKKPPSKMDVVLETDCSILRGKSFYRHHVTLTKDKLMCRPHKSKRNRDLTEFDVNLRDVLISRLSTKLPENAEHEAKCIPCGCCKTNSSVINYEESSSAVFVTVVCFPYTKPVQEKGLRKKREIVLLFESDDAGSQAGNSGRIAKELSQKVNNLSLTSSATPENDGDAPDSGSSPQRRQRFLVCINPFSGRGRAQKIYNRDVKPVFDAANIDLDPLYTKRQNHAREYATKVDYKKYDAVVIVSGDGLIFEWLNGIMERPDRGEAISLPMGIIPAGSGNALASAMLVSKKEQDHKGAPLHSAWMTAKGRPTPMDVVEVHYKDQVVYSFLAVAWGIISDIDIESEWLRFLGSPRFTIQAFIRILNLRKYRGRLSYLPAEGYEPNQKGASVNGNIPSVGPEGDSQQVLNNSKSVQAGDGIINPSFRREESLTSDREGSPTSDRSSTDGPENEGLSDKISTNDGPPTDSPSNQGPSNDGPTTDTSTSGISSTNVQATDGHSSIFLPKLSEPVPSDWVTIEDKFVSIVVMQDSHLSRDIIAWPNRAFDEGVMCIQYATYPASKLHLLEVMGQMADGSHMTENSINVLYAKAFRIEPLEDDGIVTIDGERVEFGPIQGRMMDLKANILLP